MKAFIIFLLLSSVAFGQWGGWASRSTTTETTEGALKSVNDSLYYFNYPQSTTGNPIYYWWSSSAGYLYILADSLGVGSAGNPEATGMIKVDSLGDGSLHQTALSENAKSIYLDSAMTMTIDSYSRTDAEAWTIEMWVHPINDGGVAYAVFSGSAGSVRTTCPSATFYGPNSTIGAIEGDSSKSLINENWTHFALVANGTDSTMLYQGSTTVDDTLSGYYAFSSVFVIDRLFSRAATTLFFKGYMDEVRVWSTRRTLAEINENKLSELVGNETGLVYYFTFDDSIGSAATTANESLTGTATYSTEKPF